MRRCIDWAFRKSLWVDKFGAFFSLTKHGMSKRESCRDKLKWRFGTFEVSVRATIKKENFFVKQDDVRNNGRIFVTVADQGFGNMSNKCAFN